MTQDIDTRADGYAQEVTFRASPDCVFEAVGTLGGLRGWWTPIVVGSSQAGGQLHFGFDGLDEEIVMRLDQVTCPSRIEWTCLEHSGDQAWEGTTVSFEVREGSDGHGSVLAFRHSGLPGRQVQAGWGRFLASLQRLADTGEGAPFRSGR